MKLRSSPASPYSRKARMAAQVLGLADKVEVIKANTRDPNDPLIGDNPLGKIPILLVDGRAPLFDSLVICEYFDALAGSGTLFPSAGEARWEALRLQALAQGIMDASIQQIYERRYRPEEKVHQPWLDRQQEKIDRSLALLESAPPEFSGSPDIGDLTLACALGYLDFRFEGAWRGKNPKLVGWLDAFAQQVPAFADTAPHD